MHTTLAIAVWFTDQGSLPSLTTVLLSLPVLGFLLFVGSRSLNRSRSKPRVMDRILTNEKDDKGVPVFFDIGPDDGSAYKAARAACRNPLRPR